MPRFFAGSVGKKRNSPPPGVRDEFWDAVTRGVRPETPDEARRRVPKPKTGRPRGRPKGSGTKRQNPFDVYEEMTGRAAGPQFRSSSKSKVDPRTGFAGWNPPEHPRDAKGRFVSTGRAKQRGTRLTSAERLARRYQPRTSGFTTIMDVSGDLLGWGSGRTIPRTWPHGHDWKSNVAFQWRMIKEQGKITGRQLRSLGDQVSIYGKYVNASLEQRHSTGRPLEKNALRHVASIDSAISKFKAPGDNIFYAQLPKGIIKKGHSFFYPGYLTGTNSRHPKHDQIRIQVHGGDTAAVISKGGRKLSPSEISDVARHLVPPSILRLAQAPEYHVIFPRDSYFRIYRAYDNGNTVTYYAVRVPKSEADKYANLPLKERPRSPLRNIYHPEFPWDIPYFPSRRSVHEAARILDRLPTFSEPESFGFSGSLEFKSPSGRFDSSKHPRGPGGRFVRSLLQQSGRALFNPETWAVLGRLGFGFGGHVMVKHEDPSTKDANLQILKTVFGGKLPSRRELARVIGAPDGSQISVSSSVSRFDNKHYVQARFKVEHPSFTSLMRSIWLDSSSGRKMLGNESLYLKPPQASKEKDRYYYPEDIAAGMRPAGLGARLLATQVREARRHGISRIHVSAASDNAGGTGAYTWARLGYNGYIPLGPNATIKAPSFITPRIHAQTKEPFTTVHDIMSTPAGRAWWKSETTGGKNYAWFGYFNTSPRSRHSRFLDEYLKSRGIDLDDPMKDRYG
jgi:hypothetical protein